MTVPLGGIPEPQASTGANRRRHGRVRVVGFQSSLGDIMDISASGVRIRTKSTPVVPVGQTIAVLLDTPVGGVEVVVRVVWWKKAGWFHYEAGLQFENVTPEARAAILDLAKAGDERV